MSEKTKGQNLAETLFYKKKNAFELWSAEEREAAQKYCVDYMKFLDDGKTEREALVAAIRILEKEGFREYKLGDKITAGDKLYYNNREKSLYIICAGTESIECGVRVSAAHIDSPRLDLKQHPLYESDGLGYFKTHYYGGVRKYQWITVPLALHGTVIKANGESVDVRIGDNPGDPVFCITDLLPHLAQDQNTKPLGQAFSGEGLNILIAGSPYFEEDGKQTPASDKVKLMVMAYLNEKYGMTEADFMSAELCLVPAANAVDVGLDRWLIGAYGHDDRVCAYPSLTALFGTDDAVHTSMVILADKEEIGSEGNTGMQCDIMVDIMEEIARALGGNFATVKANSKCLSSDVTACFDPNFAEVFEKNNSALLNCGVVLTKYTGSRGKGGTNDANAEYIGYLRKLFDENGVIWQTGELGRVDVGGGGTVAKFIANMNIDTVDIGVPVISMHAPYEVVSKADVYSTYEAFCAFVK